MTADQCLEHPWLKQYPQSKQTIEAPIQHECETTDSIIAPLIEVEVRCATNDRCTFMCT